MKKSFTVFVIIACSIALNSSQAFASHNKTDNSPGIKAITAVHHDFPQAQHIIWTQEGKEFIAKFNSQDSKVTATYDNEGNLLSTMISSDAKHIPFRIQTALDKKYPSYTPQTMTEYMSQTKHCYYLLLKSQKGSLVRWLRLETDDNGNSRIVQKLKQTV